MTTRFQKTNRNRSQPRGDRSGAFANAGKRDTHQANHPGSDLFGGSAPSADERGVSNLSQPFDLARKSPGGVYRIRAISERGFEREASPNRWCIAARGTQGLHHGNSGVQREELSGAILAKRLNLVNKSTRDLRAI